MDLIDFRTGKHLSSKIYSGDENTQAIDMVVNYLGIFMLANIGDGFKDISSADSYTTQNGETNFAIIQMDHDGNIIEIESYDPTDAVNNLGAEFPQKLFVGIKNKQQPIFAFISTKNDASANQGRGLYITQLADQDSLFAFGNSVSTCSSITSNCELCHSRGCFKWVDGYKIHNGECKLIWDDYFYHQHDDSDDSKDIDICLPCHQTCKTCSDSTEFGCISWDIDKVLDSTFGTCTCDPGSTNIYLGLDGTWVPNWDEEFTGIKDNKWVRTCPEDSDNYSQKTDLTQALPKSTPTNWESLTHHFYITENVTVNTPLNTKTLRYSYSATFWMRVSSTSYDTFTILSYGKI